MNAQVSEVAFNSASTLTTESVIEIEGLVNKRPEGTVNQDLSTGAVEVEAHKIRVLSQARILPFDITKKDLYLELPTLLDNRSLTLRHPKISSIFKIQETIASTFRKTLVDEGFTEVFVPTIVPSATEGGAEVFKIDYYGHDAYLAQSPQLYKQIMVSIFERVFTLAHAYRAEPSVTTRHLAEYVSLDVEMGFISSYQDLMDLAEKIVKNMFAAVQKENKEELKLLGVAISSFKDSFPRIKMREAQEIVYKRTGQDRRNEPDLDPADEKEICKWAEEEHGVPFVFITHFPTKKRPFYTLPDPENPEYTLSFDLLGINEEWVTGGQRINDYQMLLDRIKERGNKPENFEIYLQAFRYGMPPEGGFAMGLERITKDMLGIANVREASLFPRDMERVDERLSSIEKENSKKD